MPFLTMPPHCHATAFLTGIILIFQTLAVGAEPNSATPQERLFAERVWPLLRNRCLGCHGEGKELAGGLDLRTAATARAGGDSGTTLIQAGKRAESSFWRAIVRDDAEFSAMPPKESDRLSPDETTMIGEWIDAGAVWPEPARLQELLAMPRTPSGAKTGVVVATSGGQSGEWSGRTYSAADLWAYQPLRKPAVPILSAPFPPIDAFLEVQMRERGLSAAPPTDRRTLIHRATFDLLGLPPSYDEVQAFLADPAEDSIAFAKLVDRLLGSPHYGERWGRHWLDVSRYADSAGLANDYERGSAWRYRDYVVRALNRDKPYDQFVREQIAGDEIDPNDPEMLVATGFLRMGPWELTGMEVAKVARQRFLDDVTDVVGQVFLAHPLQCARCHDHKFDPVPTRDYYRMQAVFATTQLAERAAPFLPEENISGFGEQRFLETRRTRFQGLLAELDKKEEAAARQWCQERGFEYVPRQQGLRRGIPEERLPPKHVGFDVADYGMERIARKGLERLRWELDRYQPYALAVYSGPTPELKSVNAPLRIPEQPAGMAEATAILAGGDPFSPTEKVTPGALSAVESFISEDGPRFPELSGAISGRRRALAEWITHPRNPLTARVIANRVWQWHFGEGLAGNPNNFGSTGKKPTHPELLDYLATSLMERGWSLKSLHRLIMSSQAYQRSSVHPHPQLVAEKDPLRQSYAVFRPRRLTAEELRDRQLAVSGELNRTLGGIPARPEVNEEVALQPRQVMGTFAAAWQPAPLPSQRHRRSLYVLRIRGLRDPMAEVFNEPSSDVSCEAREESLVTPQVFALLNSQSAADRALALAARVLAETASPEEAIDHAFRLALGRLPTQQEKTACQQHWSRMTARHRQTTPTRKPVAREVVRQAVEENTGEPFEFVEPLEFAAEFVPDLQFADVPPETRGLAEVCLVLLNTHEFVYVY